MKKKINFEDYSSGRVIYGAPGATNFPVGLASDIFEKCKQYLNEQGSFGPYSLYDPFCGAGYSLTVLGLLHGQSIKNIFASDVDKTILEFAHKNLSLLSTRGIDNRISELEKFIKEYKKDSHKEALKSALVIKENVNSLQTKTSEFQFDMLKGEELPKQINKIDLVITDVPYGKLANWEGVEEGKNPIQITLDKIKNRLNEVSIVAVVLNKKQEIKYNGYEKIKTLKFPKRKVFLLKSLKV